MCTAWLGCIRCRRSAAQLLPCCPCLPQLQVALETARKKRLNELLQNHCKKALSHITSHKVRMVDDEANGLVALVLEALALHAAAAALWRSGAGVHTPAG